MAARSSNLVAYWPEMPHHGNVHARVAEVVSHRQALDMPAIGQAVAYKVHAPHFIDTLSQLQRHALIDWPLGFLASSHGQIGDAVEPIDTFVVHPR